MNDEELAIENHKLYRSDAVWQEIIIDMSERATRKEEEIKANLKNYIRADGADESEEMIPLHVIRPNCHAKVFYISGFNIDGVFPDNYGVENVYCNPEDNTVIGLGAFRTRPKWLETDHALDVKNLLFVVHYQVETSLLFVYSQGKSEIDYKSIAEAFTTGFDKIPRNEIHRVLGEMSEFEMFNTGMQNRYAENGESYRIIAGSNVASSIDPVTGKMYSAGHVFCKAISREMPVTIGYSSGSKIWSSSYLSIPEYVQWCDVNGRKIANENIVVKTNTNYDYMPMPKRLQKFPKNIFFCLFSDKTYTSPPVLMQNSEITNVILTDASILIESISHYSIELILTIDEYSDRITYNIDGSYKCNEPTIFLKDGRNSISLADYLNDYPLIFKTTDDTVIEGNEICTGAPDAIVFSTGNISPVAWDKYHTDIRREYGEEIDGKKPIQTVVHKILNEKNNFDYLIFDHGSGEIADYITIKEYDHSVEVVLYHAKAMGGENYNGNVADIYEVTQQAIKSIIWLKSRSGLLDKIRSRRKSNHCILQKGDSSEMEKALKQNKLLTARIVIVQPAISRNIEMPAKFQEVLAAADFYIKNSGRVTKLEIWGS